MDRTKLKTQAKEILQADKRPVAYTLIPIAFAFLMGILFPLIMFTGMTFIIFPIIAFILLIIAQVQVTKATTEIGLGFNPQLTKFDKTWKAVKASLWTVLYLLPWLIITYIGLGMLSFVAMMQMKQSYIFTIETEHMNTFAETQMADLSGYAAAGLILMIVGCVILTIKSLQYVLAQYMVFDIVTEDMKAKDIVKKSREMMKGHKGEFFVLQLSFLGWSLLIAIIASLFRIIPIIGYLLYAIVYLPGMMFLQAYMSLTYVRYYDELKNNILMNNTQETLDLEKEEIK